jgi:hypothetical protein
MPIPDFNDDGVLPPHNGNPEARADMSPFPVTTLEICQKLGTTPERRTILSGFLQFRASLARIGVTTGFQWLDGSFVEDIERLESRAPNDLDVVTFYHPAPATTIQPPTGLLDILTNRDKTKQQFHVDHLAVSLASPAQVIVDSTRYWCGLFSHQRETGIWKGILRIDLNTVAEDTAATQHLAAMSQA